MSTGPRIVGYFGTHVTMARIGRIGIWAPFGDRVLFKTPDGKIHFDKSYGFDVFLANLRLGKKVRLPVYATFVKVFSNEELRFIEAGANSGKDLIGLSTTFVRW
jgi:hypothetical protein